MCTVTWRLEGEGYVLFSNRDERRSRAVADAPRIEESGGVPYVAPTDPDAGGTWISANAHGLALSLLNEDAGADPGAAFVSRGALVRSLAPLADVEQVAGALDAAPLERFRGFRLVALVPGRAPSLFAWDRSELRRDELGEEALPLVSSSFGDRDRVARQRALAWRDLVVERGGGGVERLLAFHRSRYPEPGPGAVCMERGDAQTVSGSWIEVDAREVRFRYCASAPADADFGAPLVLPRGA